MLINVKMPTIVAILTLKSMIYLMHSCVEHEKSFITWGPGYVCVTLEDCDNII